MPISRYRKSNIVVTHASEHENLLLKRGVSRIAHISFSQFSELRVGDVLDLNIISHTWVSSDRLFKLSHKYYGDPTYWWVIAYFNNKPLETDYVLGQIVEIPTPLEQILIAMEY